MKKFIQKNIDCLRLIAICLVISTVILFFTTKNSPLYPFNNWVDENAFFTVGKSWKFGVVPYKDIFEQKGPLLYFIFMLASIISSRTFIGVFIFEVLALTITLYYCSKIIRLFLDKKYIFPILVLFTTIICISKSFVHGGSAEELTFPLLSVTLYYFFRNFILKKIDYKELFITGIAAGLVSMIKFNLLGLWFAFMAIIFFDLLIKKEIKRSFLSCLFFLCGMFIPISIFCIYFLSVHGLEEFIKTYFIYNVTGYVVKLSLFDRLKGLFKSFYSDLTRNFIIFNLIYVGIMYFVFNKKLIKNRYHRFSLIVLFVFSFFGIYWGITAFDYYFLFIEFYIIFGLIAIFIYFIKDAKNEKHLKIINIIVIILSTYLVLTNKNIDYSKNKKSDLVQYKFAQVINKKKDAKILNYGFLDGGFYMAADIIPNTMYFELQNMPVANMSETLDKEISEKKFDYIICRTFNTFDPRNDTIYDNYNYVMKSSEIVENIKFTYYLYEKKN